MLAYYSVKTRGSPCLRSQSETMKLKTDEGKDYYNLWFILYSVQTAAVYSKHDASVKAVEMGDVSILQLPCML